MRAIVCGIVGQTVGALPMAPVPVTGGGLLVLVALGTMCAPSTWVDRLPWLASWRFHGQRSWTYRALAVGVEHRLDEHRLRQCFGELPQHLLRLVAGRDATAWCERMARWHQGRSQWHLVVTCLIATAGLFLIAAGLIIGMHHDLLGQQQDILRQQGF